MAASRGCDWSTSQARPMLDRPQLLLGGRQPGDSTERTGGGGDR